MSSDKKGQPAWLKVVAGLAAVLFATTAGSHGGNTVATGDPAGCVVVAAR